MTDPTQKTWIKTLAVATDVDPDREKVLTILLEPIINERIAKHFRPYFRGERQDHDNPLLVKEVLSKVKEQLGLSEMSKEFLRVVGDTAVRFYMDQSRIELQSRLFHSRLQKKYDEIVDKKVQEENPRTDEDLKKLLLQIAVQNMDPDIHEKQKEALNASSSRALKGLIENQIIAEHREALERPLSLTNPEDEKDIEIYLNALKDALSYDFRDIVLMENAIIELAEKGIETAEKKFAQRKW